MYCKSTEQAHDRRGAVLLIVLGLLFLFATLGVTFAIVAKVEGQAARNFKRGSFLSDSGAPPAVIDIEPNSLMKFVLSQIIYDTGNTSSALRGHSLLRDMYGGPEADPRGANSAEWDADESVWKGTGPFISAGGDRNAWRNAYNGTGIPAPRGNTADRQGYYTNVGGFDEDVIELPDIFTTFRFPFTEDHGLDYLSKYDWDNDNSGPAKTPLARPTTGAAYNGLRFPFNFTLFDEINGATAGRMNNSDSVLAGTATYTVGPDTFYYREPEHYYYGPNDDHYFAYDEDYDAADYNNWFLALERPDGTILIPSFHRPHLVAQLSIANAENAGLDFNSVPGTAASADAAPGVHIQSNNSPWLNPEAWRYILRPRRMEYAGGGAVAFDPATPEEWTRFAPGTGVNEDYNNWRDLPLDPTGPTLQVGTGRYAAIWGDQHTELDVDTDGDGLRDSVWVDVGYPPQQFGDIWVKPLAAIKIVDLDGRINPNTHGNIGTGSDHESQLGASPAEINPKHVLYLNDSEWEYLLKGRDHGTNEQVAGLWNPRTGTIADTDQPGANGSDDDEYVTGSGTASNPSATLPPPSQIYQKLKYGTNGLTPSPFMAEIAGYANQGRFQSLFTTTPSVFTADYGVRAGHLSWGPLDTIGIGTVTPASGRNPLPTYNNYPTDASMYQDEWTEVNPYANDPDDSLFTDQQIEALLRMVDIDASALDSRIIKLLKDNLRPEPSADPPTADDIANLYAASRIRRMFGKSFDLIHYNMPPAFNDGAVQDDGEDIAGWEDQSQWLDRNSGTKRHNGTLDGALFGFNSNGTDIKENGVLYNLMQAAPSTATASDPINLDPAPLDPQRGADGNHVIVNNVQNFNLVNFISGHYGGTPAVPAGTDFAPLNADGELDIYPKELLHGRRLNLNRPLRKYREASDAARADGKLDIANLGAELDRQILASQIYMLLRMVTHADAAPDAAAPLSSASDFDIRAHRLAQLAVNIVDFIDPDDVVTKFYYDLDLRDRDFEVVSDRFVYGVEMPRVVINEAIALWYQEEEEGSGKTDVYSIVELHNPWEDTGTGGDDNDLQVGLQGENQQSAPSLTSRVHSRSLEKVYRIKVDMKLEGTDPEDPSGTGSGPRPSYDFSDADAAPSTNGRRINNPADGGGTRVENNFTIGPQRTPNLSPPPDSSQNMALLEHFESPDDLDHQKDDPFHQRFDRVPADPENPRIEVVITLMRLRNPYESWHSVYNPYLVIDQFELDEAAIHDITLRDAMGTGAPNNDGARPDTRPATEHADRVSQERVQPWFGNWNTNLAEGETRQDDFATLGFRYNIHPAGTSGSPGTRSHSFKVLGTATDPETTTGENDLTGTTPAGAPTNFDEFIFLNRELMSPLELLNVPAFGFRIIPPGEVLPSTQLLDLPPDGQFAYLPLTRDMVPNTAYTPSITELLVDPLTGEQRAMMQAPWFRDLFMPRGDLTSPDDDVKLGDLYRFFEFVETPSRFRGSGTHWQPLRYPEEADSPEGTNISKEDFAPIDFRESRVPGKINLNAITAEEVFRALIDEDEVHPGGLAYGGATDVSASNDIESQFPHADDQNTNGMRSNDVLNSEMFRWLLLSRAGADGVIGTGDDKPFRSYAQPYIADTLLRPRNNEELAFNTDSLTDINAGRDTLRGLFDRNITSTNVTDMEDQRQRHEVLAKISGNVTTRSHVFAVWVTVGLFRVVPGTEAAAVPLLDAEIGADTGTAIRHRGFFIVDRSLARGYNGPETINNYSEAPVIRMHRIIE